MARIGSIAQTGFSLIEVVVATTILAVTVGGLAQLTAYAARSNLQAGRTSFAVVVAQQKLEEILPESDLGVNLSPAGALTSNLDGFFDFVDRHGRPQGRGATAPTGSDYLRRWSVHRAGDTLIVEVRVFDVTSATSLRATPPVAMQPGEVRIVTANAGKAL